MWHSAIIKIIGTDWWLNIDWIRWQVGGYVCVQIVWGKFWAVGETQHLEGWKPSCMFVEIYRSEFIEIYEIYRNEFCLIVIYIA